MVVLRVDKNERKVWYPSIVVRTSFDVYQVLRHGLR